MLPFFQQHFCIWPNTEARDIQPIKHKRFDRVIGLIPQSDCLFKTFLYQSSIVSKDEALICIESELKNQVVWEQFEFYSLISLVDDHWCASVWIWEKHTHTFHSEVTHIIPALAYSLGKVSDKKCTIYYKEADCEWVVFIDKGVITKLLTLSDHLKASIISQVMSYDAPIYAETAEQYHGLNCQVYPRALPSFEVINRGKLAIYQDISNPKTFFKPLISFALFLLALMLIDYTVISIRGNQTDRALQQMTRDTQDIVVTRALNNEMLNHIEAVTLLKNKQRRLALIIDAMLSKLPEDIVFEQLSYKDNIVLVTGSFQNSVHILEDLAMLPWVTNVRAIGDILPNQSGNRQVFRIEIELENYE